MFSRKYRLPANIRLESSITNYSPLFILKIAKNQCGYNRYGFIVSKKIDKRAAVRNRIRRQVRAVIEQVHQSLDKGYDMLFLLKKPVIDKDASFIYNEIYNVLKKSKIISKENFLLR